MSVREVWESRFREGGMGVSIGTGGQASASGSAPFMLNNTAGRNEGVMGGAQEEA